MGMAQRFISKHGLKNYNKAVVDLLLSKNKWKVAIVRHLKTPEGPEREQSIVKLLGKVIQGFSKIGKKKIPLVGVTGSTATSKFGRAGISTSTSKAGEYFVGEDKKKNQGHLNIK